MQRITPGNASFLGEGDLPTASGITVLSPSITRSSLVGAISLEPNPFTPNGDGINDALEVAYDITAITRPARMIGNPARTQSSECSSDMVPAETTTASD